MSVIGSGIVTSIAGAPAAQRHQARVDDATRNDAADAARKLAGQDVILEVEGTEQDGQVNADSEGTGASGRDGQWDEAEADESSPAGSDESPDSDGDSHLDLTA